MDKSILQNREDARIYAESIIETIREPLLVLAQNLDVVSANPAFYRRFRVDREATEGTRIYNLGNNQWNIPELRELLEKIIPENEKFENFEVEHEFPDIGHRIMVLNARRIHRKGGRQSLILLTIEDITDRVAARRALEESEARYHRLVEEINSIIIDVDHNGEIKFINKFAEKIFGYPREDLVGQKLVGSILPEKDRDGKDNIAMLADLIDNPEHFYFQESVGRTKNGTKVFFSWSARSVYNPQRDETSILIDGNDITGEQEARRQARLSHQILDATGNPLFLLDDRKKFLFVNRAFAEFAESKVLEIEGINLSDIKLPVRIKAKLERAVEKACRSHENWIVEAEQENRCFEIRVELQYVNDCISGVLVSFNDITERQQAEEALKQLNETLEQQVAQRTELAEYRAKQLQNLIGQLTLAEQRERQRIAKILHDHLQQLLAGAKINSEILSEQTLPENREIVEKVQDLISQSIQTSRSLTAELVPPVFQLGLSAVLEWISRHMKETHGIRVETKIDPHLDPQSEDVMVFLYQSARELLFNIVKHAGVKSARLELDRNEPGQLRLTVSDQGSGFDPSAIWKLKDTGFGLLSIRERAALMGGKLQIKSSPGHGASFSLIVPIEANGEQDEEKIQESTTKVQQAKTSGDKIRVLLVDDHTVVRQGLSTMLNLHSDIEVIGEAADGEEAVEKARELQPDVILMDVTMPKMDGIEASRIISSELHHIRIIGLSMHKKQDQADRMIEAGASAYCTKDGDNKLLLSAIRVGGRNRRLLMDSI